MVAEGRCPFAAWRPTRHFGYPRGTRGQLGEADCIVDHIMAGWKRTLDDAGWREANGVGVHFGIGRDGSVSQYVSLFDASHGHGVSGSIAKYDRSNRHLASWERRPGARWVTVPYAGTTAYALIEPSSVDGRYTQSVPNCRAVSKEHEGFPFDRAGFDATWPPGMVQASREVDEWIMEEFWRARRWEMTPDAEMKIGHFQIDGVHRANCPGPEWPKAAILAGLEGRLTMGQFEELKEDMRRLSKLLESVSGLGVFVRAHGTPTVYLLTLEEGADGGAELVKRSVSDPATFEVMGGNFGAGGEFDNVREVDPRHLARVREAPAIRSVAG